MRTVAIVPVKHHSERVREKNFRVFHDGQSLFERKLDQLKSCGSFDEIYVSSNSDVARTLSKSAEVRFLERDEAFCDNQRRWSDVIGEVLRTVPEADDTVAVWAHTTSPFFEAFDLAIKAFRSSWDSGEHDGLVAVQPFKGFLLGPEGNPVNYGWGPWHPYSQDLPDYSVVTGGIFVIPLGEARALRYLIGRKPKLYPVGSEEALDIDTPEDFEFGQFIAQRRG